MPKLIDLGPSRYQPDPNYAYASEDRMKVDQRKLAFFVGLIALGLPIVILLGSAVQRCSFDSISHYYYAQFLGDLFVGSLIFIGTFLIVYRGESGSESLLATLAGFCAYGIALFPTSGDPTTGDGCPSIEGVTPARTLVGLTWEDQTATVADTQSLFLLFDWVDILHFGFSAALFAFLAYYAFFVFTRVTAGQREDKGELKGPKRIRNRIYNVTGAVILISMAAMGANGLASFSWWDGANLTFWFETAALWSFGISWIVKGRFFNTLLKD